MSDTKNYQADRVAESDGVGVCLHGVNSRVAARVCKHHTKDIVWVMEDKCPFPSHRLRNFPQKELILQRVVFNVAKVKLGSKAKIEMKPVYCS